MTPKNALGMSAHPMLKWDVTNVPLPEPEVTYLDFDSFIDEIDVADRYKFLPWDLVPYSFDLSIFESAFLSFRPTEVAEERDAK